MLKTYHLLITGKVQGVFYRAFAQRAAHELHISGYAKNTPDGKVEITAQGTEQALKEFIQRCRQGPPRANVKTVNVTQLNTEEEYANFTTR